MIGEGNKNFLKKKKKKNRVVNCLFKFGLKEIIEYKTKNNRN